MKYIPKESMFHEHPKAQVNLNSIGICNTENDSLLTGCLQTYFKNYRTSKAIPSK